jgi:asparagine synthase (glutamine-hydrolysing)
MCGFVGFVVPSESGRLDLETWSDCIRHRGPDQSGQATVMDFGIGTRRLSIQDLSDAGNQPMQSDRYILGFNGEIYNHHEIRARLLTEGQVEFMSNSDTETVLRAIERWGVVETLARLNGMYAISVWDKQACELSLARDPLGIKPIFYLRNDAGLYFGSEIKALIPMTDRKISREGVALYFYFGFVPAPFSLIVGFK